MRFILNLSLILTIASCNITNNQTEESFSILSDLEGKSFDLNLYEGNVIILNIWATWCKPCIAEFESLEKVREKFKDKNIKIVAVSNEDLKLINSFLDKRNFDLEFIKLNGDLSYFNAYSLPTTVVFDKNGDESFILTGGVDFNTNNFIEKIYEIEKL